LHLNFDIKRNWIYKFLLAVKVDFVLVGTVESQRQISNFFDDDLQKLIVVFNIEIDI